MIEETAGSLLKITMIYSQNLQNALMIRILQLGISTILLVSTFCNGQPSNVCFSNIKSLNAKNFNSGFSEYCSMDSLQNFETNAVVSNFFGDHKNAVAFATKDAILDNNMKAGMQIEKSAIIPIKQHFKRVLHDSSSSDEDQSSAKKCFVFSTLYNQM